MNILILTVFSLISCTASAEVADKIQSYQGMWFSALLLAALLGGLSYIKPLFLIPAVATSLFFAYGYYDMASDYTIRQLVLDEKGTNYFILGYFSSFTLLATAVFGAAFSRFRNKQAPKTQSSNGE